MRNRLLRPFLIVEFLIAIQAIFTFWSQVGGQYHLDLMFWPWKFGLSLAAATLIVAVTANLVKNGGAITRLSLTLCSFLIVVIVVAGMDGALPSVVGGLVGVPVIAVPTSVGYGASFGGVAALLAMLNSCASGVTVVNIDNGFGAAMAAARILRAGAVRGEAPAGGPYKQD